LYPQQPTPASPKRTLHELTEGRTAVLRRDSMFLRNIVQLGLWLSLQLEKQVSEQEISRNFSIFLSPDMAE
jgi:hypothetical protein